VRVDLWQIWWVVILESLNLLPLDLLNLNVGHEICAFDSFQWLKLAFLLDHEFVNSVHKNKTVMASRDKESLIVGELGR